jgi:hypothetical protein
MAGTSPNYIWEKCRNIWENMGRSLIYKWAFIFVARKLIEDFPENQTIMGRNYTGRSW